MKFERIGVEILRDHVKDIMSKVRDEGTAVLLTRYGDDIAALVPLEFLLLAEEVDLLSKDVSAAARGHFLDVRQRCTRCGKKADKADSLPLFGPWHFPTCSRYRMKTGVA